MEGVTAFGPADHGYRDCAGPLAVPAPSGAMLAFLAGAVLLVVGMGLFTLGTDLAMIPIGEHVGAAMTRSKKLWVVLLCSFLVGVIVTISEPDLQVLAHQVPGVPDLTLIVSVALGVGVFLVLALPALCCASAWRGCCWGAMRW